MKESSCQYRPWFQGSTVPFCEGRSEENCGNFYGNILREIGVWNFDGLKTKKDQLYYFRIEQLLQFRVIIGLRSDFIWGYVNLDDPLHMD